MYIPFARSRTPFVFMLAFLICQVAAVQPLLADEKDLQETLLRMEQLLNQQQQELEAQRKELAEQRTLIQQLQQAQHSQVKTSEQLADSEPVTTAETTTATTEVSESESGQEKAVAELARNEQQVQSQSESDESIFPEDRSNTAYTKDFPGAWYLPGTTSAMKIGGYVNLTLISSFDPMLISDRFITGSIPPEGQDVKGAKARTDVTASQTRLNLEVRKQTSSGPLRAFVEGDFEGDGDTLRLRHAFGQYRWMLAGKTWSTLMDVDSRPEEVDFEGINGEILLRQSQIRFFPRFGQNMSFKFAIENPHTDVVNGTGLAGKRGDLVMSVDRLPLGDLGSWNSRVGFILRDLEAQNVIGGTPDDSIPTASVTGWGVTTSGKKSLTWWGGDDFLLWQLTYGKGIGRYINDLATIGGGDAVFDEDGDLHALPVLAGYFSYQHRWPKDFWVLKKWPGVMRSNFTMSMVDIDNFNFQADRNYQSTLRASLNLIYQPAQDVRLGMELLWGQRKNKDDSKGTATQLQISARYDF